MSTHEWMKLLGVPTAPQLKVLEQLQGTEWPRGLIDIVGGPGSGRSTTLAMCAVWGLINAKTVGILCPMGTAPPAGGLVSIIAKHFPLAAGRTLCEAVTLNGAGRIWLLHGDEEGIDLLLADTEAVPFLPIPSKAGLAIAAVGSLKEHEALSARWCAVAVDQPVLLL